MTRSKATAALFLAASALFWWMGIGERSAYALTSAGMPDGGLFGYNFTLSGRPLMAENSYYFDQTLMFSGAGSRFTMYFTSIRPLYAFLASTVAVGIGVLPALQLINYLSWMLAAAVTWRFAMIRFRDATAASIATAMVAFGLGFVIHIHDYSPHILPFALSYLGILIVYESRVWEERRTWSTHLLIGLFFAAVSLAYSAGLILAVAYVLVALRRNQWWHVLGAAAVALSSQYVWALALNAINASLMGRWEWINVQAIEQQYLALSLQKWLALAAHPLQLAQQIAGGLLQFASFECPLLVAVGLWCWLRQSATGAQRWFDVAFGALPIAVGLLYLNTTTTRGYLVYGMSLLLYATLAGSMAAWVRGPVRWRSAGVVACVAVIATQIAWSSAHLWGQHLPAKMFFGFGYLSWIPGALTQGTAPVAMSLTGGEPAPVMFGGAASLSEAGAYILQSVPAPKYSLSFALVCRVVLIGYLGALALVAFGPRRIVAVLSAAVVLLIAPPLVAQAAPLVPAPIVSTFDTIGVDPGQTLRHTVHIGDAFRASLSQRADAAIQFFAWGQRPPFALQVLDGEGALLASSGDGSYFTNTPLTAARLAAALDRSPKLTLEIEVAADQPGTTVFGWQRTGLAGRAAETLPAGGEWGRPLLPAFEVWLFDRDRHPVVVGF